MCSQSVPPSYCRGAKAEGHNVLWVKSGNGLAAAELARIIDGKWMTQEELKY